MEIYTSYFSNARSLYEKGVMQIGIALYPPKWFKGPSLKNVAPTRSILYGAKGQDDYTKRYKSEVLSRVDPTQLVKTIELIANGRDVALCCFEKPEDFCHRHILADWLKEETGIYIREFRSNPKPEPKKQEVIEQSLF